MEKGFLQLDNVRVLAFGQDVNLDREVFEVFVGIQPADLGCSEDPGLFVFRLQKEDRNKGR